MSVRDKNKRTEALLKDLIERSFKVRRDVLEMTTKAGSGHPGGSLSCVDILVTLYFHVMRHEPRNPTWPERDRFILSKGHAAPALYAVLAEAGYFPRAYLQDFRKLGSILQGHPDRNRVPGVENSSGSLGIGLSIANGMALAARLDKRDYRVYVLLGDGECDEGLVWEAAMFAAHYKLDNLVAIIDRNGLQIDGPTEYVLSVEPLSQKWRSFGWHVLEVDGHKHIDLIRVFDEAKTFKGRPSVVIAHTVKGEGVSFMRWIKDYHGKALTEEELKRALTDLEEWRQKCLKDM
jgi:transketolase